MLFKSALLAGMLAAGHAAAYKRGPINALLQPGEDVEEVLRRDAELMAAFSRRQDANPADAGPPPPPASSPPAPPLTSLTPASSDPSQADNANWDEETRAACGDALGKLNGQASNPSGIAVCYNLPFLDNKTGVFQAELRMYNVSAPINPWVSVTAADVSMTLSYLGATVQTMNGNFSKRDLNSRELSEGRVVERQSTQNLTEFSVLMYVGRINSNLLGSAMTQEALKPLLVPQMDLSAVNPITKQVVTTTLSGQGASFVNGVFADAAANPTNSDPQAAASATAAVVSLEPFVIPGTHLAFLPIGLIVTSTWALFFFLAVGLGTYGRIQFRDSHRRAMRVEQARGVRTI